MKLRICRCFRFEFSILAGPSIFLEISYYEHMDIPLEKVSVSSPPDGYASELLHGPRRQCGGKQIEDMLQNKPELLSQGKSVCDLTIVLSVLCALSQQVFRYDQTPGGQKRPAVSARLPLA